jgi:pyrophosphatase PpaX
VTEAERGDERTILFDLDGTLIDTIELIQRSFWHTLESHGHAAAGRDFWRRGIGRPLEVQFGLLSRDEVEITAMVRTYRSFNASLHDELVAPYPGVIAALEALRAAGLRLGVVTSKVREMALHGLRHTRLDSFFDVLVCADEVTRPKPHPEPVSLALRRLQVAADRAWFVGDSPFDLACGRAAGVATAAVTWGAGERAELQAEMPDRWLTHPAQLVELAQAERRS